MKRIHKLIIIFVIFFSLSGITVFPVETEINLIINIIWGDSAPNEGIFPGLHQKMVQIRDDLPILKDKYHYIFYGFDWLGFTCIVLSILFLGTLRDPLKNKWVFQFGLIFCLLVIPMAILISFIRGIPLIWVLFIDCSFGIIGSILLIMVLKELNKIERRT